MNNSIIVKILMFTATYSILSLPARWVWKVFAKMVIPSSGINCVHNNGNCYTYIHELVLLHTFCKHLAGQ